MTGPKEEPEWMKWRRADMLTPEEIEDLRRDAKETHKYCYEAFKHLRSKPRPP